MAPNIDTTPRILTPNQRRYVLIRSLNVVLSALALTLLFGLITINVFKPQLGLTWNFNSEYAVGNITRHNYVERVIPEYVDVKCTDAYLTIIHNRGNGTAMIYKCRDSNSVRYDMSRYYNIGESIDIWYDRTHPSDVRFAPKSIAVDLLLILASLLFNAVLTVILVPCCRPEWEDLPHNDYHLVLPVADPSDSLTLPEEVNSNQELLPVYIGR